MQLTAWSVFGILVCNLLVMVSVAILVAKIVQLLKTVETQSGPAINSARSSLAKIETLAKSTEEMVRDSVKPVLSHVQETTQAVSQSAAGVRRMVGRVEDAVQTPIRIISAAGNAMDTPAGKASLLALGMGAARYAMTHRRPPRTRESEPISAHRSNGASASS